MSIWFHALRPQTLGVSIFPVLMGASLAHTHGKFHFISVISALLSAIFIQIGTNFANDYFDYQKGADTPRRLGPVRATAAGLIAPHIMKFAMIIAFIIAVLCGSYIMWRGGLPIIIIGILGIIFGVLYTGGPYPLGYNGLGDIFVLLFFGPIAVAGTYYVQALHWSLEPILLGFAPGLFSVAILTVNNLRDIDEDRQTGKRTLAVRFGRTFSRIEFTVCLILGASIPFLVGVYFQSDSPNQLGLFVLIPAIKLIQFVWQEEGKELNNALSNTGKLLMLFTVLWIIGEWL
jgi:1,4-dihydroxy-2-naphthoate octaprenyltransferase